ncbi:flagellar protein FlaG [Variovorax sp. DXTD-1]|uniref:flagellar protein FlaG n=1 Tax=Variovorax sp. DXTD-1 TaxID=2495592 RepID=UPI001C8DF4F5|nr:flagellar protein FlaG [Variovorax sp. DXTD-1]
MKTRLRLRCSLRLGPGQAADDSESIKKVVIMSVVDYTSGEVIRQIPSEEVVRIAKVLGKAPGLLVSQEA